MDRFYISHKNILKKLSAGKPQRKAQEMYYRFDTKNYAKNKE